MSPRAGRMIENFLIGVAVAGVIGLTAMFLFFWVYSFGILLAE